MHIPIALCLQQRMTIREGERIVGVVGGGGGVIKGFSLNIYIQVSILSEANYPFRDVYLPLDFTCSFLLSLVKYHFCPFTHNGECFQSTFLYLYLPNTLIFVFLKYVTLLLSPTSLLNCPNLPSFGLLCCYFVADGEKSAV